MRLFIFIVFIIISGELNASEPVEFNPKLLSKVLKRQFDLTDFNLYEIFHSGITHSISDNQGKYFRLQSTYDSTDFFYVYIGRVLSCRTGGCGNPALSTLSTESEYFEFTTRGKDSQKNTSLFHEIGCSHNTNHQSQLYIQPVPQFSVQ